MTGLQTTLAEEFKLLWRATRQERARFMLVQYNHYDLVRQIQTEIQERYPERTFHSFNLNSVIPDDFANELLAYESGFVSIENFEEIFKPTNEKFAITLNQRRDAFREKNVVFLIFLPIGDNYLQKFSSHLPDLFSVVSPIIQLIQKQTVPSKGFSNFATAESTLYNNKAEAEADIARINLRLSQLEAVKENLRLKLALSFDLGKAYLFLGNFRKAKEIFTAVLKKSKKYLEAKDWTNVEAMLGWVEHELGNNRKATQLIKAALKEDRKYFDEEHPIIAERKNDLAMVYYEKGDFKEAAKLMENSLNVDLKNFDKNNPIIAIRKANLGQIYLSLNKIEDSIRLSKEAIKSDLKNFGNNSLNFARSQAHLALAYQKNGKYDKSIDLLNNSLRIILKNFSKNHPYYVECLNRRGLTLTELEDYKEGIKTFEELISLNAANFGKSHISMVIYLDNFANLYVRKKDYSKAKELLLQAKNILKSKMGNLREKAIIRNALKEVNQHLSKKK